MFGQFQPNQRTQYSEQYNLTLQRQLGKDIIFQIGYVGTQGHRLLLSHDLNAGNPQTCLDLAAQGCVPFGSDFSYTVPACPDPACLATGAVLHLPYTNGTAGGPNVPCPYFNAPPACLVVGPNATPITLVGTRPFSSPFCQPTGPSSGTGCPPDGVPVFTSIFAQDTVGNSNYNSLQTMLEKHFSRGLQFQAAYTFSRSIDNASSFENIVNPFNFRSSRSLSLFDARHRFVVNGIYDLPFNGNSFLEGWQLAAIVQIQSGSPINIITSNSTVNGVANTLRPDVTGPIATIGTVDKWFDTSVFKAVPAFGSLGRNVIIGPGFSNTDFSVIKNTSLGEKLRIQFRAEFFDLFNHANLGPPGGVVGTPTFGQITSTRFSTGESGSSRQIQFAVKISL